MFDKKENKIFNKFKIGNINEKRKEKILKIFRIKKCA